MVWFSSSLPLPSTQTTQIYAYVFSENDFTKPEKKLTIWLSNHTWLEM